MRNKVQKEMKSLQDNYNGTSVLYIADFPGLTLENHIPDGMNASVEVVVGEILVELPDIEEEIPLLQHEGTKVRYCDIVQNARK